jgi:hypothetical protein
MAGGDLSEHTLVSEQYLLDIEREAFLSLVPKENTRTYPVYVNQRETTSQF